MLPIHRKIYLFSVVYLVSTLNYAQVIHGIDFSDIETQIVSNQQPDLISVPEILNGILSKGPPSHSTQEQIEYILIYAASLRNQITDIFGQLIYLQYQDLSITEIDALYQVYQEILDRKFNIFDILPEILSDGNIRPISVCGRMLPYASPCLKSSCLICSDISSLDRIIFSENVARARFLPTAKQVFRALRLSHHYPHSNKLPGHKRFSASTVLSYLKAGKIKLTNKLLLGLLAHAEYDTFDSELRTAERHVIAEIYRRHLNSAVKTIPDYTQYDTAGLFLKNYLPNAHLKLPKNDDTFLAEHIRHKLLAVNENVEYLGYIYENGSVNIKYLFELILSNDTLDNDVIGTRNEVRTELETYDILEKYLTIDKYQQISPDQLLLDILSQLKDINFMYNSVSALYTHARFWRKSRMIENLPQLLELFDAFNNLRDTPEHDELISTIGQIKDSLMKSPNMTFEILCTRPRSCLRIALKIISNCNDVGKDTAEFIDRFLGSYNCNCSLAPLKIDTAISATTEKVLGTTETVLSAAEITPNFSTELKETGITLEAENLTSVSEMDHSSASIDAEDNRNRTESAENLCSNDATDCSVDIPKLGMGIENKTDDEALIAEGKNDSSVTDETTETKESVTIDDTKKISTENVTELVAEQTLRPEGLEGKIQELNKENCTTSRYDESVGKEDRKSPTPATLDEETNDVLAVGHAKVSENDRTLTSSTESDVDCQDCNESTDKADTEAGNDCSGPKCFSGLGLTTAERTSTEIETVAIDSALNSYRTFGTRPDSITTLSPISTFRPPIKKAHRAPCHHRDPHRQKKLEKLRKIARLSETRDRKSKKHWVTSGDADQIKKSKQSHKQGSASLGQSDHLRQDIGKLVRKQKKVEQKDVLKKQSDVRNRLIKNSKVVNTDRATEEDTTKIDTDFSYSKYSNIWESSSEKSADAVNDTTPQARMLDLNMPKFFNFEIKRDETITDAGSHQKREVHLENRLENDTKSDDQEDRPAKKPRHCKHLRAHLTAENSTDEPNAADLKTRMLDFDGEKFFNMEFKRDEVIEKNGIRSKREVNEAPVDHEATLNTTENDRRTLDINLPKFVNFEIKRDETIGGPEIAPRIDVPSNSSSANSTEENRQTLDVNMPKFANLSSDSATLNGTDKDRRMLDLNAPKFFNFEVKRDESISESDVRSRSDLGSDSATLNGTDENRRMLDLNAPKFINFEVKRDETVSQSGVRSRRSVDSNLGISNTTEKARRTMDLKMPKFFNFEVKRDETISDVDVRSRRDLGSDSATPNATEKDRRMLDLNAPKFFNFEVKRDETIEENGVRSRRHVDGNVNDIDAERRTMDLKMPKFFNFEMKRDESVSGSGVESRQNVETETTISAGKKANNTEGRMLDWNMPNLFNIQTKNNEQTMNNGIRSRRNTDSEPKNDRNEKEAEIPENNRKMLDLNAEKFVNFEIKRDETIQKSNVRSKRSVDKISEINPPVAESGNESPKVNDSRRMLDFDFTKFANVEIKRDEKVLIHNKEQ